MAGKLPTIIDNQGGITLRDVKAQKASDDSLTGIAAVRAALASKQSEVCVYTWSRFHDNCDIFGTWPPNPVDFATIGSSNVTRPGLNTNLGFNLLTTDRVHIREFARSSSAGWRAS